MRYLVMGSGGVGAYFGAKLVQSGADVTFVARGDHLSALNQDGLRIESWQGWSDVLKVKAVDSPSKAATPDVVILGVKAWHVEEAADLLRPAMGTDTFVVPLQNGVEAPMILAGELGVEHVVGGLCYIVSYIEKPGCVRHASMEPFISFGELDGRPSERCRRLEQAFKAAGVNAEESKDINAAMWEKFMFISSMSGIGAVTRSPIGVVRSVPETRELLEAAVGETAAVALARGIKIKDDAVQATLSILDSLVPEATASMQRDMMEGRPSELSFQSGSVVRLGREVNAATPVHSFLFGSLLPLELKARGLVESQ